MKKMLAVTLVLVFTCALLFALGCSKKTETSGTDQTGGGMEQTTTPPAATDTTMQMSDTTHTMH